MPCKVRKVMVMGLDKNKNNPTIQRVVLSDGRETFITGDIADLKSYRYYEVYIIDTLPLQGSIKDKVFKVSNWLNEVERPLTIKASLGEEELITCC